MVELQSCATLVNASALCAIEQEVKGDSVNIVAEISAELERERQKNAELLERISVLEAQIRERDMEIQGNHQQVVARSTKRQKAEIGDDEQENRNVVKSEMASQHKPDSEGIAPKEMNPTKRLVNWMSMDDSQISYAEKLKDSESVADFNETDSDDACEDNYDDDMVNGQRHEDIEDTTETVSEQKEGCLVDHIDEEPNMTCMKSFSGHRYDPAETSNARQKDHEIQRTSCLLIAPLSEKSEVKAEQGKEMKENVRVSQNRKPQKVAFCPKEVKRIIESKALLEKNAQSHTIRKIIVFASLGIRHGCEDMYELDFNHFSILKKGEPYVSPMNPGEHVLYENPGVRRKIFYPNRENPVLCPVQILEEERAMRPSDASCPSYLFLCIKYGGRTRNLPQNEYVRQRMGRNKLKSFGPLMCRMATLVHIRSGSFFFKALGITLLFMAGFPGDLVQRETKYRNLDLLQKYYRTDEDAEKEELFLPHPIECDNGTAQEPQNVTKKTLSAKSKGRKHANAVTKSNNDSQKVPSQQLTLISSAPSQFGLSSYSSAHTYSMATFHSMASSQISKDASHIPNPSLATSSTNVSVATHSSYRMLPPQAASTFVPVMYWPPPNAFLHGPFHSPYGYHQHSMTFPSAANYMSFQTRPYYNHPTSCSSLPKLEGSGKNDLASDETESDSNSSSGGNEHK